MRPPWIIAEIAQGFEGDAVLVDLFVKAAVATAADAVKFQIFYADELALPDYQYYALFKSLELPGSVWKNAADRVHAAKREFYSDVFGARSLQLLLRIGADGFKIHTTDVNNTPLLKQVARTRKKVFLSTGGCSLEEIDCALTFLKNNEVTLLYGFQAEPTGIADNNLRRIGVLMERFGLPVGFQDHTAGDSVQAWFPSFIALGLGVTVIEKHLTLSRTLQLEDHISALEAGEFRQWALRIKEAYRVLGVGEWAFTRKESEYRQKVRRAVCASRLIAAGKLISMEDIVLKRSSDPAALREPGIIIGRIARRRINKNCLITKEKIR